MTISDSMAAATAHSAPAAPAAAHNWWVQVGAFRSHQQAKAEMSRVSHRFASLLAGAEASVDGGGHAYRARFSGLTQVAAKEACSAVRTRGLACAVGRPV